MPRTKLDPEPEGQDDDDRDPLFIPFTDDDRPDFGPDWGPWRD